MLKHGPHCLFEHDHVYISFMWQGFLLLNLDLLSSVKMSPARLTLALTCIVHARIVPHRHMYWHCLLGIVSKMLGGLPHYNPFIAQLMLGLLMLQVHEVLRYLIFK